MGELIAIMGVLVLIQLGLFTRRLTINEAVRSLPVKPHNPVAQSLEIHTANRGCIAPGGTIVDIR